MHARNITLKSTPPSPRGVVVGGDDDDSAAKKKITMKLLLARTGFWKHLLVVGLLLILVWIWQSWKALVVVGMGTKQQQQQQQQEQNGGRPMNHTTTLRSSTTNSKFDSSSSIVVQKQQTQQQKQQQKESISIPECPSTPWKSHENLVGTCPGELRKYETKNGQDEIKTAIDCANLCCNDTKCISWQFRSDVGCMVGGDVRLGMEKDKISAWCSDHPPQRWQGQYLVKREKGKIALDQQKEACSTKTWNPKEQPGQCFGLGDVRKQHNESNSAQQCMEACCAEGIEHCGAWQYHGDLGCFYGKRMYSCTNTDNPVVFEPYVGRRKVQSDRTYVGPDGKPFIQQSKYHQLQ